MGYRLSKIYTRTGDDGTTGLADGSRLPKEDPRIEAIGTLDELNAHLGLLASFELPPEIGAIVTEIQHRLLDLGGELATPDARRLPETCVTALEQQIDRINAGLPPLKEFILPGGGPSAAQCHLARTLCRRAERRLLSLHRLEPVSPVSIRYLNRLSDLLFVVSRRLARDNGGEVLWRPLEAPPVS
ncbi:MAG: ATP:cob(I)alamin adenosyltransferase [Gammaproteobacteria bacterium RIFOXYA12_FULL_61_12]|nr:MAG: ATP:cob(I)alamin adenosyltransferase [Gammaproteobacteria bacterium RIFOXYD12_FULL_61_37]OGT89347.1 MAG: ATP:cob(I)alamin adenosyltransferase [Gammaproteobacteria bacterium RIFOXYA12_FULL_61_12]